MDLLHSIITHEIYFPLLLFLIVNRYLMCVTIRELSNRGQGLTLDYSVFPLIRQIVRSLST